MSSLSAHYSEPLRAPLGPLQTPTVIVQLAILTSELQVKMCQYRGNKSTAVQIPKATTFEKAHVRAEEMRHLETDSSQESRDRRRGAPPNTTKHCNSSVFHFGVLK